MYSNSICSLKSFIDWLIIAFSPRRYDHKSQLASAIHSWSLLKVVQPIRLEPYRKRLKRCAGCLSEFLHDRPMLVVSKREWHTYFDAGHQCLSWRKCSTTTAHHASFAIIQTFALLKLSSVSKSSKTSNCRTVVTLVVVCMRVRNKRDVCVY